jgi:ABC-type oligopeptide transport system substrate-binding subunit
MKKMKKKLSGTAIVLVAAAAMLPIGCQKKEPAAATGTEYQATSETPSAPTPGPMTATEETTPAAAVTPTAVP